MWSILATPALYLPISGRMVSSGTSSSTTGGKVSFPPSSPSHIEPRCVVGVIVGPTPPPPMPRSSGTVGCAAPGADQANGYRSGLLVIVAKGFHVVRAGGSSAFGAGIQRVALCGTDSGTCIIICPLLQSSGSTAKIHGSRLHIPNTAYWAQSSTSYHPDYPSKTHIAKNHLCRFLCQTAGESDAYSSNILPAP